MKQHKKIIILGSGPAGYTAAIYAARALLDPLLITGAQRGGQLTTTATIENYPGFAKPIKGTFLMEQMEEQAKNNGAQICIDEIVRVDLSKKPFSLYSAGGEKLYLCEALIIATGAKARWLGLESEERYKGYGVSACATCDGFFYRNKKVLVVGGGNTALEEALYLANLAKEVTLIHRRQQLRAEPILQKHLFANSKIKFCPYYEIDEILGTQTPLGASVTGARIKHTQSGDKKIITTDGVFIAIGHEPATQMFANQLERDSNNYLCTQPNSTRTNIEGVFAAGDVADPLFAQAITAASTGCMAALEAEKYLSQLL